MDQGVGQEASHNPLATPICLPVAVAVAVVPVKVMCVCVMMMMVLLLPCWVVSVGCHWGRAGP